MRKAKDIDDTMIDTTIVDIVQLKSENILICPRK